MIGSSADARMGRMLGTGLKVVFASMLCLVVLIALVM
jgi:hypothetical protein